jgi:hypothetical protein
MNKQVMAMVGEFGKLKETLYQNFQDHQQQQRGRQTNQGSHRTVILVG